MLKTKTKTRAEAGTGAPTSSGESFGVYVHWPFCAAKCPYCDFNSHVRHGGIDAERFLAGYLRELSHFAQRAPGRSVTSVFFGGGTPSLMPPRVTGAILDAIASHWTLDPNAEITLEANPTSVEAENFKGYAAAGVNRLSLGVQALDDASLKALGRLHTADEALAALRLARQTFSRVSFDLIYAREGQSPKAWEDELTRALSFAADHLSLYQLTIEQGTPFFALQASGKLTIPDQDRAAELYEITREETQRAGLPAYEVSNHAAPGAECRHNLVYWRYQDYAGIGPGAHGRLTIDGTKWATATERNPEKWWQAAMVEGHAMENFEPLLPSEEGDEMLLMGLRLREGLDLARYEMLAGRGLQPDRIAMLQNEGLVEPLGNSRLRVTPAGMIVLDAVVADLAR